MILNQFGGVNRREFLAEGLALTMLASTGGVAPGGSTLLDDDACLAREAACFGSHAPLRPELKNLRAPTLFVWGGKDMKPPRLGQEMAALAPHGRCEVVADAGRVVWFDQPEKCSKLTIDFLKSS